MPLSQRSGRIVNGPKIPTLPQLATKFDPTISPSSSAAKDLDGLAINRVRIKSASPKNVNRSCKPMKVPKANLKTLSALEISLSLSGRISVFVNAAFFYSKLLYPRIPF